MSKNSKYCPKCRNDSFTKNKSEPFYNVDKPEAISLTYWKCQICGHEEIESMSY